MYVPGSQACSGPNGEAPLPPSAAVNSQSLLARIQQAVAAGNAAVLGYRTSSSGFTGNLANEIATAPSVGSAVAATGSLPQSSAPACGTDQPCEVIPLSGGSSNRPAVPPLTLSAGTAPAVPTPANLCWGLRNQVIRASQFDPDVLARLQFACMQKGYTGTCSPPPKYNRYLAGQLPRLNPSQAEIDAIPAVDVTGVPCAESYSRGGLAGLPPWGNAIAADAGNLSGWFQDRPGLVVVLGLLAVAALSQTSRRRG